jgi:uncharacterized protein YkwD
LRRRRCAALLTATAAAVSCLLGQPGRAAAATSTESAISTDVLRLLNSERAANHLPALGASTALISSAHRHNLTMAKANLLSHQLPGEPVFSTRISQAGVAWHSAAENIGWTTARTSAGAQGLEQSMYNEKAPNNGHRLNILSTSVHYVGIDVLIDAATGKLWLTEDFADVRGPVAAPTPSPQTAAHNPIGYLDSAVALTGHRIRLRGWAADPDNRAQPLNIAVHYGTHPLGWFHDPAARPDVAKAKQAGPNQGFDITVAVPAGKHSMCVWAINIGGGTANPLLGCRTVTD